MTQQICASCRHPNNLDDQFCARCGQSLMPFSLASRNRPAMTVGSGSLLPAPALKQVGQAVAVSLLAIAAEAGLAWLRRRVRQMDQPGGNRKEKSMALVPRPQRPEGRKTILSQRVVQVWRDGRLSGQLVEQSVWQELE